jgi:Arc/MetJ-type ribon-helix-helix transcriptional regulator
MTQRKERLTVTVDPELVDAGNQAVAAGRANSLSGWVNAALADRATRDRRLEALAAAIADYEAEFGEITHEEIASLQRSDRENALVVRGRRPRSTGKPQRPGRGVA